jgi:hypothetical protein
MRLCLTLAVVVMAIGFSACGEVAGGSGNESGHVNSTPLKENGEPSREFEEEDIERAEAAPQSVREYCEGAVSEAQEVGCLSHVEASEVP